MAEGDPGAPQQPQDGVDPNEEYLQYVRANAAELGLEHGQFVVPRTKYDADGGVVKGEYEYDTGGWQVSQIMRDEDGKAVRVRLDSVEPIQLADGLKHAQKIIPVQRLLDAQPDPDRTIPREEIEAARRAQEKQAVPPEAPAEEVSWWQEASEARQNPPAQKTAVIQGMIDDLPNQPMRRIPVTEHFESQAAPPAQKEAINKEENVASEGNPPSPVVHSPGEKPIEDGVPEDIIPAPEVVSSETTPESGGTDLIKPTAAEIFSSPGNIETMLRRDDIDTEIRDGLRLLVDRWQELQELNVVKEVWGQHLGPNLEKLISASGNVQHTIDQTATALEGLRNNLETLHRMVSAGEVDSVAALLNQEQPQEAANHLITLFRNFENETEFKNAVLQLDEELDASDAKLYRFKHHQEAFIDDRDAEALQERAQTAIEEGKNLDQILTDITEELIEEEKQFPTWQNLKRDITDIIAEGHTAIRFMREPGQAIRLGHQLEGIIDALRNRRPGVEADLGHAIYGTVQTMREDIAQLQSFVARTRTYAQERTDA